MASVFGCRANLVVWRRCRQCLAGNLRTVYYHTSVSAGGAVAASREVTIGKFNPTVNVDLNANLKAHVDLEFLNANYVFATPVLGGQFALGMTGAFGRNDTSIDGTLTAMLGPLVVTRQGSISDSRWGVTDLYPLASLRWNQGVNNFMTYLTGDIPVGTYNSTRLANFGIGHGAVDGGVGYTYFNPKTGQEFSVVTGLTYNLENTDNELSQRGRLARRLGSFAVSLEAVLHRRRRLFLRPAQRRQRRATILGDIKSRVAGVGPQSAIYFLSAICRVI